MTRNATFDDHVARGLLEVIGQAGHYLKEAEEELGKEEREDASREPRDLRGEQAPCHVPESEVHSASVDAEEGDLAARRLFALVERASEVSEVPTEAGSSDSGPPSPPSVGAPSREPPPMSAQKVAEPLIPVRSAPAHGKSDSIPQPNPWCLALAEVREPKRQLIGWLEARLGPASTETD